MLEHYFTRPETVDRIRSLLDSVPRSVGTPSGYLLVVVFVQCAKEARKFWKLIRIEMNCTQFGRSVS